MNKCAKFHKDSPSGQSRESDWTFGDGRFCVQLCIETLCKWATSVAHLTNLSFEFFYEIFTEDASLPILYHGAKKSKMTKTQIKGGSCLKVLNNLRPKNWGSANVLVRKWMRVLLNYFLQSSIPRQPVPACLAIGRVEKVYNLYLHSELIPSHSFGSSPSLGVSIRTWKSPPLKEVKNLLMHPLKFSAYFRFP